MGAASTWMLGFHDTNRIPGSPQTRKASATLPVAMKVRDLLKKLHADGWLVKNQEGSHRQLVHPKKPGKVTVNGHPSDEVAQGTLKSIVKHAGMK